MVHHTISPCDLWHRRLGHLHFKALPGLQRIVKGMPSFDYVYDSISRGCTLGKNVKNKFPSSHTKSKGILDLVHLDLFGAMSTPSLSGYLYYALFIDDLSYKDWIYFMGSKGETFCKVQEFKSFIENQTSRNIRSLRSDNGG